MADKVSYATREGNNFNLVRMIAAYFVIIAHAFAIQGTGQDIVVRLTGVTHLGQMAVYIFVFLSGIFITKSVLHAKNGGVFIVKRLSRIYPAYLFCLCFTLIIGSAYTTLETVEYWFHPQTWNYFFKNLILVSNEHFLPGVFEDHPISGMNGVLWFLTFEIRIYLLWFVLKCLGLFDNKERANLTLLVLLIFSVTKFNEIPFLGGNISLYGNPDFPQYTITFIIAALVYLNVEIFKYDLKFICLVLILMLCFIHSSITVYIWAIGFILIALWFGTNNNILRIKCPDYSYGIFLFGWPIGQMVYEFLPNGSPYIAMALTAFLATIVGWFVQKYIEIPIAKKIDSLCASKM